MGVVGVRVDAMHAAMKTNCVCPSKMMAILHDAQ